MRCTHGAVCMRCTLGAVSMVCGAGLHASLHNASSFEEEDTCI
jgi:hypothetical protein